MNNFVRSYFYSVPWKICFFSMYLSFFFCEPLQIELSIWQKRVCVSQRLHRYNKRHTEAMDLVQEIYIRLDGIWRRFEAEPPHTQALVGATAGFTVAMVTMNILKTTAFVSGIALLVSPTFTNTLWSNNHIVRFDMRRITDLLGRNTFFGTGFTGGFLLGFSYS